MTEETTLAPLEDGTEFAGVSDPAVALFALPHPWHSQRARAKRAEDLLDEVIACDHDVPIGEGRTIRVREAFTLRSWLRWPRRGTLFLTSCFSRGDLWGIPVDGYDGMSMLARRGFFAFNVDYLGIGESYRPHDGLESTFEANQEALRIVVRYLRHIRAVPRLDIVAESWGGVHGLYLGADAERIRSCALSTMTYRIPARPEFLTPEYRAFLDSLENHYLPMGPDFYRMLTAGSPPEVTAWAQETQPGLYLTTHFVQSLDGLPHFDPGVARVPGLLVYGSLDRPEDGEELASLYGTDGAELFVIEGAGHGPRLETRQSASAYWKRIFEFIDPEGVS